MAKGVLTVEINTKGLVNILKALKHDIDSNMASIEEVNKSIYSAGYNQGILDSTNKIDILIKNLKEVSQEDEE